MSKAEILKKALASGPCFGLNCAIPSPHTVEILASSSYDFLVIDAEHPPTNPAIIHTQLTAMAASPSSALIKIPSVSYTHLDVYKRQALGSPTWPSCAARSVGPNMTISTPSTALISSR